MRGRTFTWICQFHCHKLPSEPCGIEPIWLYTSPTECHYKALFLDVTHVISKYFPHFKVPEMASSTLFSMHLLPVRDKQAKHLAGWEGVGPMFSTTCLGLPGSLINTTLQRLIQLSLPTIRAK